MLTCQQSPLLGEVWVSDQWAELPTDGRLGFHTGEVEILRRGKADPEMWEAVALVKQVFLGAWVCGCIHGPTRRRRWERTWAQSARFGHRGGTPSLPDSMEDDDG